MRKPKIYLETSVISHLQADDRPDRMAETLRLWSKVAASEYEVVIGSPVLDEIRDCGEPKRSFLEGKLRTIKYEHCGVDDETERIANEYIGEGGLKRKSETDATHLAIASLANCDYAVSWNCRHIVNAKAMRAVDTVNTREGLKLTKIITPDILLGGDDDGI
ncbi:hypothetical protein FACS1894139_11310 [Planctomycetales bacterium]|jgi:hypothetical protein|nr:PIN domain nuclease [Planctomycetota bacterium]GHS92877.1 hypothetical protein FACS1894107_09740 [Planctomycetales bacterium]GHS98378.1 hypothetical protein FACS1894108_06430 [Planctomycetales bacterium]GHT06142.1 hypothetical protein FACS1894139_11310 [Planctomycetales bacterium]GHV20791.1 hypothetical protein AGMMS49959_08840 [Planctomycetales bacterium]